MRMRGCREPSVRRRLNSRVGPAPQGDGTTGGTPALQRRWRCALGAFLAFLLFGGTGCPPQGPVVIVPPEGPPRELSDIVEAIDRNAALLDRAFWSNNITAKCRIVDEDHHEHVYNLEGNLLFQEPRNLLVDLRPGLGDPVMQIGSNADDYWVWIEPEMQRMWWGRHRHAGKSCAEKMVVRPAELMVAIGLGGLPSATVDLVGPLRRYGKQADILYYARRQESGEMLLDREYWVSRRPPYQVIGVKTRDALGRVSMSALLDDHAVAWPGGPIVPRQVNIMWPLDGGTFTLWIEGAVGIDDQKVNASAFDRPTRDRLPGSVGDHVVQIDAECDEAATDAP